MNINDVKVSFATTTHNETDSLKKLLDQIFSIKQPLDEVILVDDFSDNEETKKILAEAESKGARVFQHALDGDFAVHKNFMTSKCKCPYIVNLDADELLSDNMATSFREILSINEEVDMFRLPRINKVEGIALTHVQKWRWQITQMRSEIEEKPIQLTDDLFTLLKAYNLVIGQENGVIKFYTPIINWPDFQSRIYKNNGQVLWQNKVHEILVGYKKFANFPQDKKFSILHYKTIEKQEKQNEMYTKILTK